MATAPASPPVAGPTRTRRIGSLLSIALILIGALVVCYPVAATWMRNTDHVRVAENYRGQAAEMDTATRQELIARARAYNEENTGGPILDPWLARVAKDNDPYLNYLSQLNTGDDDAPFGAITIPAIDAYLPIYHGTEPDVLSKGVGHLYGSALPVGGEGTHSVLTGHSGLVDATLFDNLGDVEIGDTFSLDVLGEVMTYQVDQIEVVVPEETELIQPVAGRDVVTLITCTPYGINTHRLLVRGTRIDNPPDVDGDFASRSGAWQAWMIAAIAVVILLLLVWWWLARRRRRAESQESGS